MPVVAKIPSAFSSITYHLRAFATLNVFASLVLHTSVSQDPVFIIEIDR
jgi:hypothetical protein